jgi:hypothetical protein
MKAEQQRNIYGALRQLREQEYVQEVSQAPKGTYVIVHLMATTYVLSFCCLLAAVAGTAAAATASVLSGNMNPLWKLMHIPMLWCVCSLCACGCWPSSSSLQ